MPMLIELINRAKIGLEFTQWFMILGGTFCAF